MSAARRLSACALAILALFSGASAQDGLLWLHGAFDAVESDGYRLQSGVYEYEKLAGAGDVSLYAVGYPAGSGMELLSPETDGADLDYQRMEDVSLGGYAAERWRYEDAGTQWDLLRLEADSMLLSAMIAVPAEEAEALEAQVEAVISSLSLEEEAQDAHPMLRADFDGFTTVMDLLSGEGRMFACALGAEEAVSVAITRGGADEALFADIEALRGAYVPEDVDAQRLEDVMISGCTAERWRYTLELDNGEACRTDAVLLCADGFGYAAVFGLTGEITAQQEEMLEQLISTLRLE